MFYREKIANIEENMNLFAEELPQMFQLLVSRYQHVTYPEVQKFLNAAIGDLGGVAVDEIPKVTFDLNGFEELNLVITIFLRIFYGKFDT